MTIINIKFFDTLYYTLLPFLHTPQLGKSGGVGGVNTYQTILYLLSLELKHSLNHPLLVTRTNVCFAQGIQSADEPELVAFYPENTFVDFVTFFDGNEEVTLPIKPDGLFVVQDPFTGETLALFPEAERLTAPNKRGTFKQSLFYKKGSSPYRMGEKTCLNTGRRRWTRVS